MDTQTREPPSDRSQAEVELAHQAQRIAQLEMTLEAIYASRSWRTVRLLKVIKQAISPGTLRKFVRIARRDGLRRALGRAAARLRDRNRFVLDEAAASARDEASEAEPAGYNPYAFVEWLKEIPVVVEDGDLTCGPGMPPFSIIVTVKDEAASILEFLHSVEAQDLTPEEVVVVDGGSSDGTAGLIERFAVTSALKIRLCVEPGANIARGRNRAIGQARHEILVVLDAGCQLEPKVLWNLVGGFRLHPDADLVAGLYTTQGPSAFTDHLIPDWDDVNWDRFLPSARNMAIRKSVAERIGGFPEELSLAGEDTLFAVRYRRASRKWVVSRKAVVRWQAPATREAALRLGLRYGQGDGESGFGDFRFQEALRAYRRGQAIDHESVWNCSFHGYLAGREQRARIEIQRRRIRGLLIVLSGVPISDSGGGQRGAQLAVEFIHRGYKVLYVNVYPSYEAPHRVFFDVDYSLLELYHIDDFDLADVLRRYDALADPPLMLLEFPHPRFLPLLLQARAWHRRPTILYDHIDNWDSQLGGQWHSSRTLEEIVEACDVLVASAASLLEDLRGRTDRPVHLVPNAVNLRVFDATGALPRPADLPEGKPVVLYIGALWGSWFDWALLAEAADQLPEAWFVMVGQIDEQTRAQFEAAHGNARFLGLKPQATLPAYLCHAAACIIPFKPGPITRCVNPLKVYEYLAMDKPVVATGLVELRDMPGVTLAQSGEEFVAAVRHHLTTPLPPGLGRLYALRQGWDSRVKDLLAAVDGMRSNP